MPSVNFQAPTDYTAEAEDIARRRKYAEMLAQQSMEPLGPTQMAGGWAIPQSPLSGLAKMLQAYSGRKGQDEATEAQKALASKYQMDLANVLQRSYEAGTGTPANADILKSRESLDSFDPKPAMPANPRMAASILMQHPATQPLGMQQMQRQADLQALAAALGQQGTQGAPAAPDAPAGGSAPTTSGLPPLGLLAAGDIGKTVFNALQKENGYISVPEGGALTRGGKPVYSRPRLGENVLPETDAKGNVIGVKPMPGATDVIGGVRRAEEEAKARYDLVQVPDGKGGTTMMPRSEAVKMLSPPPPVRGVVDTEADALRELSKGPGTFEVRNPGSTLPKPVMDAQSKKGELDAARVQAMEEKIPSLNATNRRLDRLMQLNTDDKTYAAAGAELKTTLASVAQAFGLPVQIKKTANSEEYIAHIAELMKERLASKDYGSGTGVSNLDLLAASRPLPELTRTREGRKQVLEALKLDVKRATDDSMAAREYFEKHSTLKGFKFPSESAGSQPPYGGSKPSVDALLEKYK